MPKLSNESLRKMRNHFDLPLAKYLATRAGERKLVTYGELTGEFGGTDRGWGNKLGGIALRCHDHNHPLLSVIVVNKASQMPSVDAVLYEDLGLKSLDDIRSEQAKCFAYDWSATRLA